MAALRLGRRLADAARLLLGGAFRHRGVTVQHPNVLLDQRRAARVIDRVVALIGARGHRARAVAELLVRIDVRFLPPRDHGGSAVDVHAEWTGGLRDRGVVLIRISDDWPDRLGVAVLSLLLVELEPGVTPSDLAKSVKEEADGSA